LVKNKTIFDPEPFSFATFHLHQCEHQSGFRTRCTRGPGRSADRSLPDSGLSGKSTDPPGVDFMKPFWPKFTDKTFFGQI
jgi:hypothetical protein